MNSGNSKTSDSHRLLLNLIDKTDLKRSDEYIALSNLYHLLYMKIISNSDKNNKFKKAAPRLNEYFELSDGSYSLLDIQDYFEYI